MALINGTPFNDTILGTAFDNILNKEGDPLSYPGTRGDDTLKGLGGNDLIYGCIGDDKLFSGQGNGELNGDTGHDQQFGGNSNNALYAMPGNDTLMVCDGPTNRAFASLNAEGKRNCGMSSKRSGQRTIEPAWVVALFSRSIWK